MNRAFEQVYGLTAAPLQEQDFDHNVLDALYAQFAAGLGLRPQRAAGLCLRG